MLRARVLRVAVLGLIVNACSAATGESGEPEEETGRVGDRISLLQNAFCSIKVKGKGARATELDYLPHVLACENNGADLEALKAQAIAARSVAYYEMASHGSICDGQGCQVYGCGVQPTALHYQAVAETAQQYLGHAGMLTYAFYVAGDSHVGGPSCHDVSGATTKYVTFNDGKSGSQVKQTKLGYVGPPGFGQNRGCMSQWGARCLESTGRDYLGILRFYYGSDISVVTAPGACAAPPGGSTDPGTGDSDAGSSPSPSGSSEPSPTPEPTPSPSVGCAGSCGSPNPVPGSDPGCYCDTSCTGFGDCCSDYQAICL